MLQSIQFNGSGPPTYVYSQNAVGASGEYYHVFATETRGYDGHKEENERKSSMRKNLQEESGEQEDFKVVDNRKVENLREVYEKEYGRRESFLWKLR